MRSITVDIDVYAAIWASRQLGEDNEDAILRRVLGVRSTTPAPVPVQIKPTTKIGFSDPRFGIQLAEGFEIFRTYKGTGYRAKAVDGKWLLVNTGATFPSLNQLSRAVSGNTENAWNNWYFKGMDGKRKLITELRNSSSTH